MAGKSNNDRKFSYNDSDTGDAADNTKGNDENVENSGVHQENVVQIGEDNPSNTMVSECCSKKEENPFSFKRFLNQDVTNLRRRNYSPEASCNEDSTLENQNYNFSVVDSNAKVLNTNEMTSVLPDFVQDHLVIEQCYLNGTSSTINIDNLNLHNLPDLNVEHRHVDFDETNSGQRSDLNHHSSTGGINLPDFTVNTNDGGLRILNRENELYSFSGRDSSNRQVNVQRNSDISGSNGSNRSSVRISSSPSVPLDLPSYDGLEPLSPSPTVVTLNECFTFDPIFDSEDWNGFYRGMPSTETVSKSLPDFLNDGPIQNDRLGENLLGDLVNSLHENDNQRISPENPSERFYRDRFQRELDMLRRQLSEKNRKIHMLESEIEDLRTRERRDLSSLEYTVRLQVERNLKQAVERASNAESALVKARQENNRLRSKLASLRGENSTSKFDRTVNNAFERDESQRIAKELRIAANAAENSLRSLLTGIDNLRLIATSVESMHGCSDKTDDPEDYNSEESASGPAL